MSEPKEETDVAELEVIPHNKLAKWETTVPGARVGLAGTEAMRKATEAPFVGGVNPRTDDEDIGYIAMQAHLGFATKKELTVLRKFLDEQKPGADVWDRKLKAEYKKRGARWYPHDERTDIAQALLWCYLRCPNKAGNTGTELSTSITEFDMFGWLTKPGQRAVLAYKQRGLAIRTQELFIKATSRVARYSMEVQSIVRTLRGWRR